MKRLAVKTVLLAILSVSVPGIAGAQQFSVSTNVMGYVDFGTLNMEASYAFARHWSVTAGARFNPFTFYPDTDEQMQRRQQAYNIGIRMWPWHTFARGTPLPAGGLQENSSIRNTAEAGLSPGIRKRGMATVSDFRRDTPICCIPI